MVRCAPRGGATGRDRPVAVMSTARLSVQPRQPLARPAPHLAQRTYATRVVVGSRWGGFRRRLHGVVEWVRTELSARAQAEVEWARAHGPYSLGRLFPDTPDAPSPDDEGGPLPVPLEDWVNTWWWGQGARAWPGAANAVVTGCPRGRRAEQGDDQSAGVAAGSQRHHPRRSPRS